MDNDPTFEYETSYWSEGVGYIAGVDEVGMGALAGPVCAAAVIFDKEIGGGPLESRGVRDSKKLSEQQRAKADEWIKENAVAWAVGEASVEEITQMNILQASHLAMERAVESLTVKPGLLLIDGRPVQLNGGVPTVNLIKGDSLSFSIAAASIVAKVYRDGLMVELDKRYPAYGFFSHKGYGSPTHIIALEKHGATACHRPTYAPVTRVLDRG